MQREEHGSSTGSERLHWTSQGDWAIRSLFPALSLDYGCHLLTLNVVIHVGREGMDKEQLSRKGMGGEGMTKEG